MNWIRCTDELPPRGVPVMTKIHDEKGARNEQPLKQIPEGGALWFYPDGSMYVYYTPTHWRHIPEAAQRTAHSAQPEDA